MQQGWAINLAWHRFEKASFSGLINRYI